MIKRMLAKGRIDSLNLTAVRKKLIEKHAWTEERVMETELEYRRFLYLISRNPDHPVVPWTEDLDEMWHTHILDTQAYMTDCQYIFGRYVHHNPHLAVGTPQQQGAFQKTRKLYDETFRKPTAGRTESKSSSGCTVVGSGCSSSSDCPSDGGSSCGSSCGGASCGGGGCGGGCGS